MLTPQALAAALNQPPPTDEQAAVIAAPAGSALVVAGAGAGKTETMAARVVWLVAIGTRAARAGPRADVHPQGRAAARGAGAHPAASPRRGTAARRPRPHGRATRGGAGRRADDRDVPRVRRALVGEHALRLPAEPGARLSARPRASAARAPGGSSWRYWTSTYRGPASVTGSPPWPAQLGEHLRAARSGHTPGRSPRCSTRPSPGRGSVRSRRSATRKSPRPSGCGTRSSRWSRPSRAQARRARARLRRPARHRRPGGGGAPRGRGAGAGDLPGRAARRVPGHRLRAAGSAARPVRCRTGRPGRAQRAGGDRGRRPVPVNLRLARCERRQPRPVPHRLPAPGRGPGRRVRPAHQLPQPAEVLVLANAASAPLRAAPGAVAVGELAAGPGTPRATSGSP